MKRLLAPACVAALLCGCSIGEGAGAVRSDRLYVPGCWNGPFDLEPDFFAANPYREEQLQIRIQRGDNNEEASDGLTVLVNDLTELRQSLGTDVEVGLPAGVSPPGQPVTGKPSPKASLSLYLHQTCHEGNGAIYSVAGTINFSSLFSGDENEQNSDKRLTDAHFSADFADPRDLVDATDPAAVTSHVDGWFRFFFQRGQPAQPFP